ncbi:MAG: AraC family transcriptional regulator [Thermoguttaceae bacterium]
MNQILIDPSQERSIIDFRQLGFRDVMILGKYVYMKAHSPLASHDHGSMLEICYLVDGQQYYQVADDVFFLNGGEVLLNYPHELHGTGFQREGRGTLFWMIISPPTPKNSFLGLCHAEGKLLWEKLCSLPSRHFRLKQDARKNLDMVFSLVGVNQQCKINPDEPDDKYRTKFKVSDQPTSEIEKQSFLYIDVKNHLLRFLIDLIDSGTSEKINSISVEIQNAINLIRCNTSIFYTMKALAKATNLSESRFKHRFKHEVGVSPADFQLREKINTACKLLITEDLPIINISLELGFSSSQYFATVFRRYMGMTPAEYRSAAIS